jgi:hypothetical protein
LKNAGRFGVLTDPNKMASSEWHVFLFSAPCSEKELARRARSLQKYVHIYVYIHIYIHTIHYITLHTYYIYICVSKTAMVHMYNRLSPEPSCGAQWVETSTRCSANWLRHFSKKERDTQEISNNKHEKR